MKKIFALGFITTFVFFLSSCGLLNKAPEVEVEDVVVVSVLDDSFDLKEELKITDDKDEIPLSSVTIDYGDFDVNTVGEYKVTITVTDLSDKETVKEITLSVEDLDGSTIELVGDSTVYLEVDSVYEDLGSTCIDNYDDDCNTTINTDNLDNSLLGSYEVYHNSVDEAGNEATVVTRTVVVQDTTPADVTLTGNAELQLHVGDTYVEEGATCVDNYDDDCTITISSNLDITRTGTYEVLYATTDESGNEAESGVRTVTVVDTEVPTVALVGDDVVYHEFGDDLIDLGATCEDNDANECSVDITIEVNPDVVGEYFIYYEPVDFSGNRGVAISRKVIVQDTEIPVLTLNGDETVYVSVGDEYNELSAMCSDNYDQDCDVIIETNYEGSFDLGIFTVTYTAFDSSGNAAEAISRTIEVKDLTAPEIFAFGYDTIYVDQNEDFVDMGAVCVDNYDEDCDVIIDDSMVDITTLGEYTVYYDAVDEIGNVSEQVTRTVIVQIPSDRTLRLKGADHVYLVEGTEYVEEGFILPFGGTFTSTVYGEVGTELGSYTLDYVVEDETGHITLFQRVVHVVANLEGETEKINLQNIYSVNPELFVSLVEFDMNLDTNISEDETDLVEELLLSDIDLSYLDFVPAFTNLRVLDISHNEMSGVNVCVIKDLVSIEELNLANNYFYNISCLKDFVNLTTLNISQTSVYSIDALKNIGLESIDVSKTSFNNVSYFSNFTNLYYLNISETNVKDISALAGLPIETLYLSNGITDFKPLMEIPTLLTVSALELDADLEDSFLFKYLENNGVLVTISSYTDFDEVNPYILADLLEINVTVGETYDLSTLNIRGYDFVDGYYDNELIYSITDTATLEIGSHTLTVTVTDSDGNTTVLEIEVTVLDDYSLANIIVFIKFSDEAGYNSPIQFSSMYELFNGPNESLRDYFLTVSNNEFNIQSIFLSDEIIFYIDENPRSYYQPYNGGANPNGYETDNEAFHREQGMLANALTWIDTEGFISEGYNIDQNDDGIIDNVTFLVSGDVGNWSDLLWPHRWSFWKYTDDGVNFYEDAPTINGKYAFDYTLQLLGSGGYVSSYFTLGVLAHEMFHVVGSPDLYMYYSDETLSHVGNWGLMDTSSDYPSHMLGYMKEAYGNWDQDEILVTTSGQYTINRSTDTIDNMLVIDTGYSNEYIYMEYRTKADEYEMNLPNEGLIVYRVDTDYAGWGNVYGFYNDDNDATSEVFMFRPLNYNEDLFLSDGIMKVTYFGYVDGAAMSVDGIHTTGEETGMYLFHSDGTPMNVQITVIAETETTITVQIDIN